MDKKQAQALIKGTFESQFDKNRFVGFVKNLLNKIDESSFIYRGNFIPDAYEQYINTLERVGKYTDGEHKVDILIAKLKKETSIERARTMQRNFIAWYLNGSRGGELKDAALVAFVAPNELDWRFSLVKMDYRFEEGKSGRMKVKQEFTPARRWSFLVGANENSHTAQSQLVDLFADDERNPELTQLEEAFNIEKVTKEFFDKYRELYLWTNETLEEVVKKDKKIKADFDDKGVETVDFSKKLLGQIVFLYFLQKKGWFGVKRDADWGTGPKNFLRELFEGKHGAFTYFFNDILEPLFYEALRNDRSHEDHYFSMFNCKIPFLNGGLFDPIRNYDWKGTDILLPNDLFSNTYKTKEGDIGNGILDIFDRYNFTVKEDEPLEKEVAVDPEMLGKVFENLLEVKDRKSKGTYYTPREIVHFMCQESLSNYLTTELEGKVSKRDIDTLIKFGETVVEHDSRVVSEGRETETYSFKLPESVRSNAKLLDEKLASIRVCDPAVGSGAFPVGMMNEIIRTRNALSNYMKGKNGRSIYDFKRHAIQNCLYGVDIDLSAVEIAKLRLWLSLIVDEEDIKQIKPLPNLDYKIVHGNSLLGVEKNLFNMDQFNKLEELKPLFFNETNAKKKLSYKVQIDDLINQITNGRKDFDFEVHFSEIFHEKEGFDVIIANPPYLGESGHKDIFREIKNGPLKKYYYGKMDIFYFFFHLSLNIVKNNAQVAFITTNYYLTATGGIKLRSDFKERAVINSLINFNELKIFEAAKGQHNIITILSKAHNPEAIVRIAITNRNGVANSDILSSILSWKDPGTDYINKKQNELFETDNNYIRLIGEEASGGTSIAQILQKISIKSRILGHICHINQGVVSGCDYVSGRNIDRLKKGNDVVSGDGIFVFDLMNDRDRQSIESFTKNEKKLLRDFYKNSDIARYWSDSKANKFLLYLDRDIHSIQEFPNIRYHLDRFRPILTARREVKNKLIPYFQLQWPRSEEIFIGPKVVVPYRTHSNAFAYNKIEWFCRSDCYVITQRDRSVNLEYVLALLNSKLYFLWFYHKGKRKGEILEIFYQPLTEVPILEISPIEQKLYVELVNKILAITGQDNYAREPSKQAVVKGYERQIDQMIYKLYGLNKDEVKIVEDFNNDKYKA